MQWVVMEMFKKNFPGSAAPLALLFTLVSMSFTVAYLKNSFSQSAMEKYRYTEWKALYAAEAGLNDVRIHDLRHSWASIGASNGTPLFVIGGVLGQVSSSTTERYAHLQNDPAKTAVEAISSTIAAALSPSDSED